MNGTKNAPKYESLVLRVLWMLVFLLVWQVAQLVLGGLVLVQLVYRVVYGAPNAGLIFRSLNGRIIRHFPEPTVSP